ncbi:MAG: Gfo/Idh/MocA family oxidoreductase [Anaerolineae bacterium]|nr:Gfo/Idh/MocA family oxidoreductase [Anaerolineae bacterium]
MPARAPIPIAVWGAGLRGHAYARYALDHPEEMRVVAVAEPDPIRRAAFAARFNLPDAACFPDWQRLLEGPRQAEALFNCTMDRLHYASTLAALERGYPVLLEKPMSPVLAESVALVRAAEAAGQLLQICHVLRYAPFWVTLRQIVHSGRLGQIISVDHRENLAYWHMAHSYVRGNWREQASAGPIILTKCSHDFDILGWILEQPVVALSSFGSLAHFRPENAPPNAPLRCTDGCPVAESCPFEATRRYAQAGDFWWLNALTFAPTAAARRAALETSPYGRCVYHCDNDVLDHQVVSMWLADQTSVTLTLNGHSDEDCRTVRLDGSRATLYGTFGKAAQHLHLHDHLAGTVEALPLQTDDHYGHGGGDAGLVRAFLKTLRGEADPAQPSARVSLESHLLAFAAEAARQAGQVIQLDDFRRLSNAVL